MCSLLLLCGVQCIAIVRPPLCAAVSFAALSFVARVCVCLCVYVLCAPAWAGIPHSEHKSKAALVVNTPEQIEIMREAGRLGREVLDVAAAALKVGVTPDEIDKIVHQACLDRNVYPSPLNYCNFPKSVCV
jgi:hypothetical protein